MEIPIVKRPLFIFLSIAGVMATILVLLAMVFLAISYDVHTVDIARVYLPLSKWAEDDAYPDKHRLLINILHEPPLGTDCSQLRYKNGELLQPCQNPEHWKIMIRGKELTKAELRQVLVCEGNLDRETPGNPETPSNRPVMIRADGSAPFELVKEVIKAAGQARIWRIDLGATTKSFQ